MYVGKKTAPKVPAELMIPTYSIHCTRKKLIAPGVYELHCTKPEGFSFKAGQFVLFDVPLLENPSDIQARAYSIASSPVDSDLLFVIKLVPGGRASRWLEDTVEEGTKFTMKGPFGAFLLDQTSRNACIFVATGTGIAPLRSQILWTLKTQMDQRPFTLIFGVLRKEDLFWLDEWKALEEDYPNFHAHFSALQDGNKSVQEFMTEHITDPLASSIYLCGSPEIVKILKTLCMEMGIPKENVHSESYV